MVTCLQWPVVRLLAVVSSVSARPQQTASSCPAYDQGINWDVVGRLVVAWLRYQKIHSPADLTVQKVQETPDMFERDGQLLSYGSKAWSSSGPLAAARRFVESWLMLYSCATCSQTYVSTSAKCPWNQCFNFARLELTCVDAAMTLYAMRCYFEPKRDEQARGAMQRLLPFFKFRKHHQSSWWLIAQSMLKLVFLGVDLMDFMGVLESLSTDASAVSDKLEPFLTLLHPLGRQDDCLRIGADIGEDGRPRSSPDFWFGGQPFIGAWACNGRSIDQSRTGVWAHVDLLGTTAIVPIPVGRGNYAVRPCGLSAWAPNTQGPCNKGLRRRHITYSIGVGVDAAFEAGLIAYLSSISSSKEASEISEIYIVDRDMRETAYAITKALPRLNLTRLAEHESVTTAHLAVSGKVHIQILGENVTQGVGSYVKETMQRLGHDFLDILKLGFGIHSLAKDLAREPQWLSKHVGQLITFLYPNPENLASIVEVIQAAGFSSIAALVNPYNVPSFWLHTGAVEILGGLPGLHISFCGPACEFRCQCSTGSSHGYGQNQLSLLAETM